MINKHNLFRANILLLITLSGVVFITPFLNVNGLIYPPSIDSVFISQQEILYEKRVLEGGIDSGRIFIYNPGEIGVNYTEFEIPVEGDIHIRGWLAGDSIINPVATVIFIPDISESRMHYISDLKEFTERGFKCFVVELRGQANSDGTQYNPGSLSANDISLVIDELELQYGCEDLALMGNRTGAAVAMQSILDDDRIKVVVIKNPFVSFGKYFTKYAINYWGPWVGPLCKVIKRDYEQIIGFYPDSLDLAQLSRFIEKPALFIAANFYTENIARETRSVYRASTSARKKLVIDRSSVFHENGFDNSKEYYDLITSFIATSMPATKKKSKFKKLVEVTNTSR